MTTTEKIRLAAEKADLLVMSCDAYSDLWPPFFDFFERYWPDCPFDLYLGSNFKTYKRARAEIKPLLFDMSTNWSDEFSAALQQLNKPFVIYLQDDYFIIKKPDNEWLADLIDIADRRGAAYLRIFPTPEPDEMISEVRPVGKIRKDSTQRTSLQAAVWRRESLLELLQNGESPWEFETGGPERSQATEREFLSVPRTNKGRLETGFYPITYFCTAVLKGKYMRGAVKLAKKEGIHLDLEARKVQSRFEQFRDKVFERSPQKLKGIVWLLLYKYF